eukprot:Sspe_Gene.13311::Locus_4559_Transcript_1_1_Confidence_1.000_Length_469::g.13311::m.13311
MGRRMGPAMACRPFVLLLLLSSTVDSQLALWGAWDLPTLLDSSGYNRINLRSGSCNGPPDTVVDATSTCTASVRVDVRGTALETQLFLSVWVRPVSASAKVVELSGPKTVYINMASNTISVSGAGTASYNVAFAAGELAWGHVGV